MQASMSHSPYDDAENYENGLRRSQRNSLNGQKHLLYDQKFHPLDEVSRPSHAKKRRRLHDISSGSSDVEEDDEWVQGTVESENNQSRFQPSTYRPKRPRGTRRSKRRSALTPPLYDQKVHPQDNLLHQAGVPGCKGGKVRLERLKIFPRNASYSDSDDCEDSEYDGDRATPALKIAPIEYQTNESNEFDDYEGNQRAMLSNPRSHSQNSEDHASPQHSQLPGNNPLENAEMISPPDLTYQSETDKSSAVTQFSWILFSNEIESRNTSRTTSPFTPTTLVSQSSVMDEEELDGEKLFPGNSPTVNLISQTQSPELNLS